MPIYLDPSIISFYVSFVGIIGMIGFKAAELRTGKKSWISRLADRTNDRVHVYMASIRTYISYINRRSALALVQWIAYHILSWARNLYIWAYRKAQAHASSRKIIDMVRGKGEVNRNGGSSFYLKSISKNDIEEEVKK